VYIPVGNEGGTGTFGGNTRMDVGVRYVVASWERERERRERNRERERKKERKK